jgi:hypothetical protein
VKPFTTPALQILHNISVADKSGKWVALTKAIKIVKVINQSQAVSKSFSGHCWEDLRFNYFLTVKPGPKGAGTP